MASQAYFVLPHEIFAGFPDAIEILQCPRVLGGIMSAVRLSQEVLDEEGLRVFLQLKHLSAQSQRVHTSRHRALKLLQQAEIRQDARQDGPVEAFAVVSHQKGSVEGPEEGDEVSQSASVRYSAHGTPIEEQRLTVDGQTRDSRRAVRHTAAGQEVRVKRPVPADGRQLHDITCRRV